MQETLSETSNENPGSVDRVLISMIDESPTNPRRDFGDLAELAASIASKGVVVPVLLRRRAETPRFELVYGARRLRASKLAKLSEIPAQVRELTDAEVIEYQLIENSQRSDVHPLDEARAYGRLAEGFRGRYSDPMAELARRTGKTRAHITKRMKLLDLPKEGQKALMDGELTLEAAHMIARVPDSAARMDLVNFAVGNAQHDQIDGKDVIVPCHISDLRDEIEAEVMNDLAKAPFDRNDANLVPLAGPCSACPKRTGNQVDLFGSGSSPDKCLDGACFKKKLSADWELKAAAAERRGAQVLSEKESLRVFHGGRHINTGSGFLDPDEKNYSDAKGRTWRQLVGKAAPTPVLARKSDGSAAELWRTKEVTAIIRESGSEHLQKLAKADEKRAAETATARQKAKLEKETLRRQLAAVIEAVGDATKKEDAVFQAILEIMTPFGGLDRDILKSRGFKSAKDFLEMASIGHLRAVVLMLAARNVLVSWQGDKRVARAGAALGVDTKKIAADVASEFREKKAKRSKGGVRS